MVSKDREKELRYLGWAAHAVGLSVVIILWAGYQFLLAPVLLTHEEGYQDRISELKQALTKSAAIRDEHEQLTQSLSEIEKRAETIRQRIPDEPREADFLRQITDAANAEGLEIRDYQVGMASETATHSQVDVRLACQGSYVALCGFLEYLAALPRITRVQKLDVSSNLVDDSYPIEISLWLYYGAKNSIR